jgi:hypothetical protein
MPDASIVIDVLLWWTVITVVLTVPVLALCRIAAEADRDADRCREDVNARAQEREAAQWLRPQSGQVTPLGGKEPPTAPGMDTDGIGA